MDGMQNEGEKIVVAYDPDFDAADIFTALGGKRAFFLGLLLSLLTLMSVGFIALAALILSGKTISL